jgi:hypothetical protein
MSVSDFSETTFLVLISLAMLAAVRLYHGD